MEQFDINLNKLTEKHIQAWKRNHIKYEKEHNKVWVPLIKYMEKLDGVSNDYKQRMLSSLHTIRNLDTKRIQRLIYEDDVDENWDIDVKIFNTCKPSP